MTSTNLSNSRSNLQGQPRSLILSPFDRQRMIFYWCFTSTKSLSYLFEIMLQFCTVSEILRLLHSVAYMTHVYTCTSPW